MARKYGFGLASIKMGNIAGDGGMGTSLTQITDTVPGSALFTTEEATTTDIFVEEEDDPVITTSKAGKKTITFSTRNMDPDALIKLFGGTKTGAGTVVSPYIYSYPSAQIELEQSFELTDKYGNIIKVVRAKVVAKFNWNLTKEDTSKVDVVATILAPTKAATDPFTITYPGIG